MPLNRGFCSCDVLLYDPPKSRFTVTPAFNTLQWVVPSPMSSCVAGGKRAHRDLCDLGDHQLSDRVRVGVDTRFSPAIGHAVTDAPVCGYV